ncbi:MAG: carboxymuconolactone decarboxylase family protein [Planctomycetota bacterium]
MTYLNELMRGDSEAGLLSVFQKYPETCRPLIAFHEALLRSEDSPFTVAQRELIAAYVSGLNACRYCHGIHTMVAERFGVEPGLIKQLIADLDAAPIEENFKAVLRYVRKLTEEPSRIVPSDAEALYEAGWDDRGVYEAVMTCALFNFMNRMVDGLGVNPEDEYLCFSADRLSEGGYGRLLNLMPLPGEGVG